jgi:NADH:ubiquinone oxidoreductase subunit 5 (subunit L)/multisubunit Na+/H+ antiporter MnhA subunit
MEGPTSVSALLHSATLVVAGLIVAQHKATFSSSLLLFCLFACGFVLLCVTVNSDPDAKRLAAISTCMMILLL